MDCTPGWLVGTKWPSTLRPRPAAFYPAALPFRWRPGAEIVSKQSDRLESRSNHVHFSGRSMNLATQMQHVPRRPRGVLIAVMLLGSLLLAGLLAFQAQRTFLHHRATAERVLRDYARLAASRFALRTGANLYYMAAWPPMEALLHTQPAAPGAGAPLPRPGRVPPGLKAHAAASLTRARDTFRPAAAAR